MMPLNATDQLFLMRGKRTQPMHVGGLFLFDYPEGAGPKYMLELAQKLRSFDQPQKPFNLKPVAKFGKYYWAEDEMFDFDYHFRHSALPKPGRIRELLKLVSVKHSAVMDRERPLWEFHLIEGLRGKQFAIYIKLHHALIDGVAGKRMVMKMLTEDSGVIDSPPIWAMHPKARRKRIPPK